MDRDQEHAGSQPVQLTLPFVSLDTLIAMKRAAGRLRDLDDIEHLEKLKHQPDDPKD